MTEIILGRARLLMQQKRYSEAEKMLNELFPESPDDIYLLSLMAEVNLVQDKFDNAERLIDTAIGHGPDEDHLFFIKSRIAISKEEYDKAEKNIQQAIALNPTDADYFAVLASIRLTRKQYAAALEYADKALELDAENIAALNIRSTALLKLDKKADSFTTMEGALRQDPNNPSTHANYGWNLLEKGEHRKALEHFREALKHDPNLEHAQAGMVQALKATNLFYRLFLKYSFWIGNLSAKYQWGVILGFYFLSRALRSVAKNNEKLEPFLMPVIVLMGIVAFSTWVMVPISNLFLRLNRYGKHLLTKEEHMSSDFVGISFVIFLTGLLSYAITTDDRFLAIAVFGFVMMVPFGSMFSRTKRKNVLVIYAAGMTVVGLSAITYSFVTGELFSFLTAIFFLGFVAFQWITNYLNIKESNV